MKNTSRYPVEDEEEFFADKKYSTRLQSMHLEHNEKKYHIKFLKDYDAHDSFYRRKDNRRVPSKKKSATKNIESLFSNENSTVQDRLSLLNASKIHRESKQVGLISISIRN